MSIYYRRNGTVKSTFRVYDSLACEYRKYNLLDLRGIELISLDDFNDKIYNGLSTTNKIEYLVLSPQQHRWLRLYSLNLNLSYNTTIDRSYIMYKNFPIFVINEEESIEECYEKIDRYIQDRKIWKAIYTLKNSKGASTLID